MAIKELVNSAKTYRTHHTPEVTRKRIDPNNSIQAQTQMHNQMHLIEENKNKLLEAEKNLQKMLASHDIFGEEEVDRPNIMISMQDRAKTMLMMANTAKEFSNIIKKKVENNNNNK